MKKSAIFVLTVAMTVFWTGMAFAHFGMLIPSDSMVMQDENRTVALKASFSHPFEGVGMELEKPEVFGVMAHGKKQNLMGQLKEIKVMGHTAWGLDYSVKRPGVYMFYMVPKPYWEAAEDCFIIHHTKTVVTAFGDDEGWDAEMGLKTEIVPLSKPFGLYAGNLFQGIVKLDGKPVLGMGEGGPRMGREWRKDPLCTNATSRPSCTWCHGAGESSRHCRARFLPEKASL